MKINEEFLEKTMSDVKIMFCDLLHLLPDFVNVSPKNHQ